MPSTINAAPGTITLTFDGNDFIYLSNTYASPLTINNTSPGGPGILTVLFDFGNNTFTTIGTFKKIIFGTDYITFDGQNIPININSTSPFPGFLESVGNFPNTIVQNVFVNSTNTGASSSWIHQGFCGGIKFINCRSTGAIANSGGGIVGPNCYDTECICCSSAGSIGDSGGGIFSTGAVNCKATNCYSEGSIGQGAGGIFGASANGLLSTNGKTCEATGCFSLGGILTSTGITTGGGGIYGQDANSGATSCICKATNCYSVGFIGPSSAQFAGGIFGRNANILATTSTCQAINCYTVATISDNCGGIFGQNAKDCSAEKCYVLGVLVGSSSGTICGPSSVNCSATNCYVRYGDNTRFGVGTVTNCIAENGGQWNYDNAISTLGSSTADWYTVLPNRPFLLAYYINLGCVFAPNGVKYNFNVYNQMVVTGYYNVLPANIDINYPAEGFIYGYIITPYVANPLNLTVAAGTENISYNGSEFVHSGITYEGPVIISNTDAGIQQNLTINFTMTTGRMNKTINRIILNSDYITFDGQYSPIIFNVANYQGTVYPGFISITSGSTNINIQNVVVNQQLPGTLTNGSGWIGGQTGWNGGSFINCTSNGAVPVNGGGIVGSMASNVTCINCFQNGSLTTGSGFIFGSNGGNNNNTVACFVNGSGPLVGASSDVIGVRTCFRYGLTPEGFSTYNLIFDP